MHADWQKTHKYNWKPDQKWYRLSHIGQHLQNQDPTLSSSRLIISDKPLSFRKAHFRIAELSKLLGLQSFLLSLLL
ncbi:Hypothetical predicted protein [Marmota monax]|uniref:Uncharacterized protein n=1 Tax=Marmota monax TaxID=9995 RepID=A0A5E4CBF6_MARMO|nr:hypothetical protein GHT09_013760 [Marmota monax]VTJ79036.1 Hypothetical predicted protein [Marmota monax]